MTGLLHETYGEARTEVEKTIDEVVMGRVKAGMVFLQETYGEDWVEHINLRTLDLASSSQCVLGQLEKVGKMNHGSFHTAVSKYFNDLYREAVPYGFTADVCNGADAEEGDVTYDHLQVAWKEQIRELQSVT